MRGTLKGTRRPPHSLAPPLIDARLRASSPRLLAAPPPAATRSRDEPASSSSTARRSTCTRTCSTRQTSSGRCAQQPRRPVLQAASSARTAWRAARRVQTVRLRLLASPLRLRPLLHARAPRGGPPLRPNHPPHHPLTTHPIHQTLPDSRQRPGRRVGAALPAHRKVHGDREARERAQPPARHHRRPLRHARLGDARKARVQSGDHHHRAHPDRCGAARALAASCRRRCAARWVGAPCHGRESSASPACSWPPCSAACCPACSARIFIAPLTAPSVPARLRCPRLSQRSYSKCSSSCSPGSSHLSSMGTLTRSAPSTDRD